MATSGSFFYDEEWNQTNDELFIQTLEMYARHREEEIKVHNSWLLELCRTNINKVHNQNFVMEDIIKCFFTLEDRYHTWKCIISRDDVAYDVQTNSIAAKANVWNNIYQNYEYGNAYREGNEHMFTQLAAIFGPQTATRRMGGNGIDVSNQQATPMQIAIVDYDNMKRERVLFQSYPDIIPRTFTRVGSRFLVGQYCPRPMRRQENISGINQQVPSRNHVADEHPKGKRSYHFH